MVNKEIKELKHLIASTKGRAMIDVAGDLYEKDEKIEKLQSEIETIKAELELEKHRLDWIDHNASFVCNHPYKIGPYKIGELRKMADDGIDQDKHKPTTLSENLGQG